RIPALFMADEEGIIEQRTNDMIVERKETVIHPETGKFMDNHLTFIQTDSHGVHYQLDCYREQDITVASLLDSLSWPKRTLAKIVGANPTYVRILGKIELTVTDGEDVQHYESEGLWEQMSLGRDKEATVGDINIPQE
ncbi:MAG: hypothetical protein PQJ60_07330, partial [Spirochaetales bacterium]|nr:hypothetical protein [Spirochaetales bacterium]